MAKSLNYNARTYDDYKSELKAFTQKYYPTVINDFNDASVGQWFMDLNAAVADDLGYYNDRMFQETQLDQAQEKKSLLNIARTNGLRVDGKRPSVVEAKWSCFIPINQSQGKNDPDYNYAPILQKGTHLYDLKAMRSDPILNPHIQHIPTQEPLPFILEPTRTILIKRFPLYLAYFDPM